MRKGFWIYGWLTIAFCGASMSAFADDYETNVPPYPGADCGHVTSMWDTSGEGFYAGLMLGSTANNGSKQFAQTDSVPPILTLISPQKQQWNGRIYAGYQIITYFGLEVGLNYFSTLQYNNKNPNGTKGPPLCSGANIKIAALDFMGKGRFPIWYFDAFGKAGLAYVRTKTSSALRPDLTMPCGQSSVTNKISPAFSVGLSYNFTPNWVIDASYNQLLVGGKANKLITYGISLSYHMVDVYCGQFLCG